MKIQAITKTSFDWLVRVVDDEGNSHSLSVKQEKEPDTKQIEALVSALPKVAEAPQTQPVAEAITVDKAIDYLKAEYEKAVVAEKKTAEDEKVLAFMAKPIDTKPIETPIDPKKEG